MIIIALIFIFGIGAGIYQLVVSVKDISDMASESKKKKMEYKENYQKTVNGSIDEEISYYKKR